MLYSGECEFMCACVALLWVFVRSLWKVRSLCLVLWVLRLEQGLCWSYCWWLWNQRLMYSSDRTDSNIWFTIFTENYNCYKNLTWTHIHIHAQTCYLHISMTHMINMTSCEISTFCVSGKHQCSFFSSATDFLMMASHFCFTHTHWLIRRCFSSGCWR